LLSDPGKLFARVKLNRIITKINELNKCVPGTWTSNRECMIAHPCARLRDVEGEAVSRVKM